MGVKLDTLSAAYFSILLLSAFVLSIMTFCCLSELTHINPFLPGAAITFSYIHQIFGVTVFNFRCHSQIKGPTPCISDTMVRCEMSSVVKCCTRPDNSWFVPSQHTSHTPCTNRQPDCIQTGRAHWVLIFYVCSASVMRANYRHHTDKQNSKRKSSHSIHGSKIKIQQPSILSLSPPPPDKTEVALATFQRG